MSMIIPKQTAAATERRLFSKLYLPRTVKVAGDLVASTIAVYEVDDDGVPKVLYDADGVPVVLSATSQPLLIDSEITLEFVKGVTANACGVQDNGGE